MDSKLKKSETPPNGLPAKKGDRDFAKLFEQPISLSQALKTLYQEKLDVSLAKLPAEQADEITRGFYRSFEPWPEWVLRIASEVHHVSFPKIPTDTIFDVLQCFNFYLTKAKLDGSNQAEFPKMPTISAGDCGAMFGHMAALISDYRKQVDEARKEGLLSRKSHAYYSKGFSIETFQQEMSPAVCEFFRIRPAAIVEFNLAFAKAMNETFDEMGLLRETTLTDIYRKILSEWPEVEGLSGPTALCEYLDPLLTGSGNDPEQKLDRVKKLCRRMGIVFVPFVKGQAHPPSASLPPS